MLSVARLAWVLAVPLIVSAPCIAADPLPREEVAKLGKSSTALVVVNKPGKKSFGSAFCVNAAGLFLTNEHVVRGGQGIDLVLNPGLKAEKVIGAKVVRADKDLDLALLLAEGQKELLALPLGSDENLNELAEVIACGFPFGAGLALDEKEFPAVSVNAGSITALRRREGELQRIQVDVVLNPGNSGGPVLDRQGKVIGVVVAGLPGSGVNFVIPVSHVTRFVARPEFQATVPPLTIANMHKEVLFQVKAVFVLPGGKAPDVELVLKGRDGKERRHKMELVDGTYRVSAVPLQPPEGPRLLRVTVVYADGVVTGSVADLDFKVGDKAVKLSEARSIRIKPAQVLLSDGKTLDGSVVGLDPLQLRLGGQELKLELGHATEIRCEPPKAPEPVAYTIIATQDGKEVGRLSDILNIGGLPRIDPGVAPPAVGDPGRVETKPPVIEGDKAVKPLPAAVGETCLAGGGRYLILHFPKLRKLGVFDVSEAKIVGYIAVADDNVKFAAGIDRVVVVLPTSRLIQRWSLRTLERELSVPLPFEGTVKNMCIGWAGTGPVLVAGEGGFPNGAGGLLDATTLQPLKLEGRPNFGYMHFRPSAEGKVFTMWNDPGDRRGCLELVGNELKCWENGTRGYVLASPDGETLFGATHTSPRGFYCRSGVLFSKEFKLLSGGEEGGGSRDLLPAAQGRYYYDLKFGDSTSSLSFYIQGDTRVVGRLDGLDLTTQHLQTAHTTFDRWLYYLPDARVVVTVLTGADKLTLFRFDIDQALVKSDIDYLLVASAPPTSTKKGTTLEYTLQVKSKKGGLKYRIESGPKGMAIDTGGKVTWAVPADFDEKEVTAVVLVTDAAGQEAFHTFRLAVRE